ncbi:MAG: Isoleucyl-tRNA synthetase [uncultured Acidimicrobiales bacterium]|uniref:Isoleucine--tRNA ligase n=1 Tax=uncultured Acidimicrobiales bacterium TaxID=310071 RepID=A0A6J4HJW0_9ACTN|nr:MAG: Isoleucyl-tRNA synthetase [uncultured Acidimicrobiales bacterium]
MAFGPVDSQLDLVALEHRVLARWRESSLSDQVKELRKGAPPWIFYEGPPTANGKPGLHHVWARAFKDLFPRFQTMRGHDVPRKGGWDCHGLPVEIEVEKELGLTNKHQIEAFGIAEFNERCRESVKRYVQDWEVLTERAGVWIDTDDAYRTFDNTYIESVWWLVRQLWDKGLLYEGHRVSPYCPRCGTALSSHELGQPGVYRDVVDPAAYVRFPVVGGEVDLLVWTTTPWTLISNVAAAVGPDIEYVRVRAPEGGRDMVMAATRVAEGANIIERFFGRDLVGVRYRRPYDFLPLDTDSPDGGALRVVAADFVTTEEGSGIVHLAPAFGNDDMDVAKAEGLPVLNPVGPDGTFDERITPWAGRAVKEADREIIADLLQRGLLVMAQDYTHSYPHCWRCGTPLIYWAKTSWFVRTSDRQADLLRENEKINWHPEHIKHGRFGDWLLNNVDWALSRDRYWGTPLPIWRCGEGHITCIGSVEELSERSGLDLGRLDLHRPAVDEIPLPCSAEGCQETALRVTPVLDAWFDSGAMPSAQHHFPFGDQTRFTSSFPADFICEAIDQTRGWFYSLLAINTLVFDSTPYRSVVCLAHIVDQDGLKMSKSKGNVIDPWDIFENFGADALRWYFFSAGSPWTSRRVYEDGIRESTRKTLLTLWNVFSFFSTYADLDGWQPGDWTTNHVMDRWVLSQLRATITQVTDSLEGLDALGAATAIATFVDDLSNWYVRRSRARFWGGPGQPSDGGAHAVLYRCLVVTSQLLAPLCPFLADEMHRILTGSASVHLTDWPKAVGPPDTGLSAEMEAARRIVGLGRAARTDAGVRTRQPLRRALLLHPGAGLSDEVKEEVKAELNVRELEDVETLSDLMTWTVVPNFKVLGPRLGTRVNEVKAALAAADGSEVRRALERDGAVEIAGERLGPDDLDVRATRHEDFALAQEGGWAVALDLELDDDLRTEGVAREIARSVNDLRKLRDLALSDRIALTLEAGPRVAAAVAGHRRWISAQVLATELVIGTAGPDAAELDVDGEQLRVDLRVAG